MAKAEAPKSGVRGAPLKLERHVVGGPSKKLNVESQALPFRSRGLGFRVVDVGREAPSTSLRKGRPTFLVRDWPDSCLIIGSFANMLEALQASALTPRNPSFCRGSQWLETTQVAGGFGSKVAFRSLGIGMHIPRLRSEARNAGPTVGAVVAGLFVD